MHSIESRLRSRLLAGGLALSALLAWAAWSWSGHQVRQLLDYQLEQAARALVDHEITHMEVLDLEDPAMHLDIAVWDGEMRLLFRSSAGVELWPEAPAGFSQVRSAQAPGRELRLFTIRGDRVIQVGHRVDVRQDLAREAGFEVLAAALAATAALSLLLVVTVRRSLAPLRELEAELKARNADALSPIDLHEVPAELQPPLAMLNALLAGLQASFTLHRQFIADAAHELRTPLAAVRLQMDNVVHATSDAARDEALAQLGRGVERVQRLVEQVLELARLEATGTQQQRPTELAALAREALVDHAVDASRKGMELALEADGPAWVRGDARAIRSLLDNLLGNALKYAPEGSAVTIGLHEEPGGVRLSVRDRGPGIAADTRQRVLERFYRGGDRRGPGSGLGLAIAAEAARAHGRWLELDAPADGPGLIASIVFPLLAPPAIPAT
jgi:two-component system OmpR family sensor kinase